ncbi:MAG: Uncharacterized protein G01um101425_83 [Candidatus Peregrinibacteria bacterium Gr01-1014_25]|nr:MAG: Uncharacterized protein G01um101425_83 [Candidatus Peregrinibacteria bacterium Gr01-1014_25]
MPALLSTLTNSVLNRIRRSPLYYERYNNTCDFTTNRTYTRYARECRAAYEREHGTVDLPESPLWYNTSTLIRGAFPADKARAYSDKIGTLIERKDPCIIPPKEDGLAIGIREPLINLGNDLLDTLRAPDVQRNLLAFFRSHYRIEWIVSYRSLPSKNAAGSWLWHSDTFPPHTCKLFLHLTKTTAETGAMEVMNREDTMAYRRAGYFGQFQSERTADLEGFARTHGLQYRPHHFDAEPGDVTLFDMNFLHRAVAPQAGIRDVVVFLFLPNMVSWEKQLELDGGFAARSKRTPSPLQKDPGVTTIVQTSGGASMMA